MKTLVNPISYNTVMPESMTYIFYTVFSLTFLVLSWVSSLMPPLALLALLCTFCRLCLPMDTVFSLHGLVDTQN